MEPIKIDSIVRSRRKTIALVITPDAKLVVRAPLRTSEHYIENLVREKSAWIRKKIAEISCKPVEPKKQFVDGEEFLFLGSRYRLCIRADTAAVVELRDRLYVPRRSGPEIEALLSRWYRSEARKVFSERVGECSKLTGCTPKTLRLSSAQRRWGSCSSGGTVSLSWRLVLAPPGIIDYVIVHELAHMLHHNHSKKFWDQVRAFMPDFEQRKKWLKFHEKLLVF